MGREGGLQQHLTLQPRADSKFVNSKGGGGNGEEEGKLSISFIRCRPRCQEDGLRIKQNISRCSFIFHMKSTSLCKIVTELFNEVVRSATVLPMTTSRERRKPRSQSNRSGGVVVYMASVPIESPASPGKRCRMHFTYPDRGCLVWVMMLSRAPQCC